MAISGENCKIFPPPLFCAITEGFPLALGIGAGGQKTRVIGLLGWQISLPISSAVWIEYTDMTDGRTSGHSEDRAYYSIAR